MKVAFDEIRKNCAAHRLMGAEMLERARLRNLGDSHPPTVCDHVWTSATIYDVTRGFDRDTRFSLLTSAVANMIAGIRPLSDRDEACAQVLRLFREQIGISPQSRKKSQRSKKNRDKIARSTGVGSCIVDPEDVALADAAFERTFRRRAGAKIGITEADLTGTLCLIHQLMQGLDYKLLIDVLSNSVTEEYGGSVPEEVFTEFERIIRKIMIASDLETQPVGDSIS